MQYQANATSNIEASEASDASKPVRQPTNDTPRHPRHPPASHNITKPTTIRNRHHNTHNIVIVVVDRFNVWCHRVMCFIVCVLCLVVVCATASPTPPTYPTTNNHKHTQPSALNRMLPVFELPCVLCLQLAQRSRNIITLHPKHPNASEPIHS